MASRFLPEQKRRAAYAVYAFCRVTDDATDEQLAHGGAPTEALDALRGSLCDALAGAPGDPVFRELTVAVQQYAIPPALLFELMDGVAHDCRSVEPADWCELERYCKGVASSVGEMCTYIFGVEGTSAQIEQTHRHARALGVAMQLTNILRDVGEDAANGRCYLPSSDLARFGLTREDVLRARVGREPAWRALMQFEIGRARALYATALPGIRHLSPDAQRCAMACAVGYAGILDAIERLGYDTFRSRARLGVVARAAVLWRAWRTPTGGRRERPAIGW
jgi:phytoene synthase